MFISVMMTWENMYYRGKPGSPPGRLEAYRLNLSNAIGMKQVDSRMVTCEGVEGVFESPLVRIDYPAADAEGETVSVYVSGVIEELEAKIR